MIFTCLETSGFEDLCFKTVTMDYAATGTTFLFCVGWVMAAKSQDVSAPEIRDVIYNLLNQSRYDRTLRPRDSESPTHVEVDMAFNGIGPLMNTQMEMTASFYLRQQWVDERLSYTSLNKSIVIGHAHIPLVWVPDLYFPHTNKETAFSLTTDNIFMRLYPNGTILYSQRLSVTVRCLMSLEKFPLDMQTCKIQMESFGYTTEDLLIRWSSNRTPVYVLSDVFIIPDFELQSFSPEYCSAHFETGDFPCVYAKLKLKRTFGYYLTQTFIPSFLIVILSWVSFWIDYDAIPARISVGLLTVLTTTTQSAGARAELPKVPYVKAIDVWLVACLVFVFAAYMEYAIVIVLARRYKKSRFRKQHDESVNNNVPYNTPLELGTNRYRVTEPIEIKQASPSQTNALERTCLARKIEKISRYAFPLGFLVFNLVYWIYYIFVGD